MQLHNLKRKTKRTTSMRVGRGGKRGKTSGRGTKGAGARAGNKSRPEWRDIIKKLPKRRGYGKNRARTVVGSRTKPVVVKLSALAGLTGVITPAELAKRGIISRESGKLPAVKVLGTEIKGAVSVSGIAVSASAKAAIEKAGGSVQ